MAGWRQRENVILCSIISMIPLLVLKPKTMCFYRLNTVNYGISLYVHTVRYLHYKVGSREGVHPIPS